MKVEELLNRLKEFLKEFEEHKDLYLDSLDDVVPSYPIRNKPLLNQQIRELNRKFAILELFINRFTWGRRMYHPASGTRWDIYNSVLRDNHAIMKGDSLRNAITDLDRIIAKLEEMEPEETIEPVAEIERKEIEKLPPPPDFEFITDQKIQQILKRDYVDIQKCVMIECWKAAIILCGSCLEAILLDVLTQRGERNVEEWSLEKMIDVASKQGIISKGVKSFSHSLRDYRNLVHPFKEAKGDYKIEREEASASFESLKMVIRDLLQNSETHTQNKGY